MFLDFKKKTLRTQLQADQLYTSLRMNNTEEVSTIMLGAMYRMCNMLVLTEQIELTNAEEAVPELIELREFITTWTERDPQEVWEAYLDLHPEIASYWIRGYENSNKSILSRIEVDGRDLTEEEKAEVTNNPDGLFQG